MNTPILTDWNDETAATMTKAPIVTTHNLHKRPMFSDDGLADILDRYPREAINLYTMDNSQEGAKESFRRGLAGDLSGKEILEAVERGMLWVNLRKVNDVDEAYNELCDEMFGEIDARTPGLKTLKRDVGVLISSPNARVFYHLDIPLVTLWQIKGEKKVYIYPTGAPYAREEQIESVVLGETEEEIDYDPAFDADAKIVDLKPGMMTSWPQNAPHRIDNGNFVNVSLSCEFMTVPGLVRANALYTNGVLRRRYGKLPEIANDGPAKLYSKAALARVMKLAGSRQTFKKPVEPSFVIDLNAENAVRDLAAA